MDEKVKPVAEDYMDITEETLHTDPAMLALGYLAAKLLKQFGSATFVRTDDGGVTFANPSYVHIHPQAVSDIGKDSFKYLRPIVGDGKPQFVAWKGGVLWEISRNNSDKNS